VRLGGPGASTSYKKLSATINARLAACQEVSELC
jgi:hypothetical protein